MPNRLTRLAAWIAALALAASLGGPTASPATAQVVRPWQDAGRAALTVGLTPFIDRTTDPTLTDPVLVTHAGDGSGRLFIVERGGKIKVVVNGQVLPTPFLDLGGAVTTSGFEQGLLGLAFHPGFRANGRFFVYYTPPPPSPNPNNLAGFNTLAEFRAPLNANQAVATPTRVIFSLPDRVANHNGGMIDFGPDGYLYVGMGDEGGGGDQLGNAQNLGSLFGKLLRIDVDRADPGLAYAIPPTNPFVGQANARGEIWAYGLRNPWRWSFDRQTGDLWTADVGQQLWEEVNWQRPGVGGQNYGWNRMEGAHCYPQSSACNPAGLTPPVAEYAHGSGDCSVTGGYVYRGMRYPALVGAYLYADWCSGRIWTLTRAGGAWSSALVQDTTYRITSFGEDEAGELYVVHAPGSRDPGSTAIYRLTDGTCSPRPPVSVQSVAAGPGQLRVTVTAGTNGGPANELRALQFETATNALITVDGGAPRAGDFAHPLASGTRQATFTVQRAGPGAMTVPLRVLDSCGVWPTFVGAGAAAP